MTDWTPEQVDTLTQMWARGVRTATIADQIGPDITRNSVIGKAHRIGLAEHINAHNRIGVMRQARRKPVQQRKPKQVHKDRKSIPGVPQAPWRPQETEETAAYEAKRRANGAMPFVMAPFVGRCKWFLAGESGPYGLQCCAQIPIGASYCAHHYALSIEAVQAKRMEAAG